MKSTNARCCCRHLSSRWNMKCLRASFFFDSIEINIFPSTRMKLHRISNGNLEVNFWRLSTDQHDLNSHVAILATEPKQIFVGERNYFALNWFADALKARFCGKFQIESSFIEFFSVNSILVILVLDRNSFGKFHFCNYYEKQLKLCFFPSTALR